MPLPLASLRLPLLERPIDIGALPGEFEIGANPGQAFARLIAGASRPAGFARHAQ
jgi:hypothetical protein